jgi:hypothetical protein
LNYITAALSRINEAKELTKEQTNQLHKLDGITVSARASRSSMNKEAGIFTMTAHSALNPNSIDMTAATFLHEAGHRGQSDAQIDSDEFIDNEKKASAWALGVARKYPLTGRR